MPELDQRTTLLYRPVNDVGGGLYDSNADMRCLVRGGRVRRVGPRPAARARARGASAGAGR
jgi:hypothetical protein